LTKIYNAPISYLFTIETAAKVSIFFELSIDTSKKSKECLQERLTRGKGRSAGFLLPLRPEKKGLLRSRTNGRMGKRQTGKVAIAVGAALLGAYAIGAVWFLDGKDGSGGVCRGVEVVVRDSARYRFVTVAEAIATMQAAGVYPAGKTWDKVDTEALETVLRRHEMVAQVEAFRTPAGKVKAVITQREPILRVMGMYGNFYVDRDGKVMPMSRRSATHLLVASGYVEKGMATHELYEIAVFLHDDRFWDAQIEQMYVRQDREVELIPRVGNHRIVLGEPEGFEEKLERLRLFYEQAIPKFGWGKYSVINLKYDNQVVCTRR
jgi:cell division protein FtsQ